MNTLFVQWITDIKLNQMKSCFLVIFLAVTILGYGQERETEAHYFYTSATLSVYTNTAGSFNQKVFPTLEFGKTYGIFDIGLATGRLNLVKSGSGIDSLWYSEIRPTINVFSKGRFSESLTLGAGIVYNAKQNFITEVTNCINFSPDDYFTLAVCQGNYFYDGRYSTSRAQVISLAVTYNFIKKDSKNDHKRKKSLLN